MTLRLYVPTDVARPPAGEIAGDLVGNDVSAENPRADILLGAAVAVGFFVVFLGWAAFAPLDAAATAAGEVIVSGHRQTVQHREGGVIGAINVHEGQHVAAGQVLVELAAADVRETERAIAARVIGLQAQRARLKAELAGAPAIAWPEELAALGEADRPLVVEAIKLQQSEFAARSTALKAQERVLHQRTAELAQQIEGYNRQIAASKRQESLIQDELVGLRSLAERGLAPQNRVRAVERAEAQVSGARGQYEATVAQSEQQAGETRLQIIQAEKDFKEKASADLRDTEFALSEALPKLKIARDQLDRIQIKAPASGAVVGLSVFTPGGVIAPGQRLMDVVPDRAPLLVDAKVSPADADDVHIGQVAEVRFVSIHDRALPIIKGSVTKLSADSLVDEKTGIRYFTVEVAVPMGELARIERRRDRSFTVKPGLPVQVLIPTHRRTALQYMVEPLGDIIWRSFRER